METAARSQAIDERLVEATTATLELFGVYLGRRLGLYAALRGRDRSAGELAGAAGIAERYAREWLEQQAVAGFLRVDDPKRPAEERRYGLPEDVAAAVCDPEHPSCVSPLAEMVVGVAGALDDVVEAYRSGGGVPYARYGYDFRHGQGAINRPAFTHDLVGSWIPALPEVHAALAAGGAPRVADVGCGHGWSTLALSRAFPEARVTGFDADPASIADARGHAKEQGVSCSFELADAGSLPDGSFDLIFLLEALHDFSRPAEILTRLRRALAAGGSLVVADEKVAPAFQAPGDAMERLMYGWSISHCLPAAMAEQPATPTGTVLREEALRALAQEAGYRAVDVADVDAGFFRVYRLAS
jgi:2-polyprenyl-3-methyl-5-hydroxy-6-metoxy-1,4-benzoquinol methylase